MKKRLYSVMRRGLICFAVISVFLFICIPFSSAESGKQYCIGWEPWAPYMYKASDGIITGLDADLVKAVMKNLNVTLNFKEMDWTRHLSEVKRGDCDLAASASRTSEREEYARFSAPYRTETAVMYVRRGESSKYKFKDLKDLINSSFRLGVTKGYYYGENYAALKKDAGFKARIDEVTKDTKNYKKLIAGRIDGFLIDKYAGVAGLKEMGILDKVEVHSLPIYSDDIFVMFSKKTTAPDDVEKFNKSLQELKDNGQYEKIVQKYLK